MSAGAKVITAVCRNRYSADVSLAGIDVVVWDRCFRREGDRRSLRWATPHSLRGTRGLGGRMQPLLSPMSMPREKEKVHVVPKCVH
jgi:hypothetical protein